jgi:hypothetical protein
MAADLLTGAALVAVALLTRRLKFSRHVFPRLARFNAPRKI